MFNRLNFKKWFCSSQGQSLIELVVAMFILGIASSAIIFLVLAGHLSNRKSLENTEAILLAQEGIEAVKSIANMRWAELACINSGLKIEDQQWKLKGMDTQDSLSDDRFIRQVSISNICRNEEGEIIEIGCSDPCPPGAVFDSYTKKIVSRVLSGEKEKASLTTYLTNWKSKDLTDTDEDDFNLGDSPDGNAMTVNIEGGEIQLIPDNGGYVASGIFISRPFDTESVQPTFNSISWENPSGFKFWLRTADSEANLDSSPWVGPAGLENDNTDFYDSPGRTINLSEHKQYIQYKTEINGDGTFTPVLKKVEINYQL